MKVHPEAVESLKRYRADLRAGHRDAAEYWRGQAGAYFTANPYLNPLVSVDECPKCHRKRGERHVVTTKRPSITTMEKWVELGVARATDGCKVEPDGGCSHGHMSWIRVLRYINPSKSWHEKRQVNLERLARTAPRTTYWEHRIAENEAALNSSSERWRGYDNPARKSWLPLLAIGGLFWWLAGRSK